MRCHRHWDGLHSRLKVEATGGETPGQWNCETCHPLLDKLKEYGHIEYSDKRPTEPYRPIPRPTPQQILAGLEKQREAVAAIKRRSSLGTAQPLQVSASSKEEDLDVVPGQSPADVQSIAVGTPSASVALEPALSTPPAPEPKPEPKRVTIDASQVDLDDPSSWGAPPKPRAKPKPKAKPKPRAKGKKEAPQSEGLF